MGTPRKKRARYLVGIDLGTTHTVVAYADSKQSNPELQLFEIEQLVAPGEVSKRPLLPSIRYHAADDELAASDLQLPWIPQDFGRSTSNAVIGELARNLSTKSHGRTVNSAKSWLSHTAVDRTADILPWGAPDDVQKISPVAASASYLAHIRSAWDVQFEDDPLHQQDITITIPASFDEAARSLTLEAAQLAGLSKARLLEEPQAVCYDWLWQQKRTLKKKLANVKSIMVCDIGGGTSDFTLIKVTPGEDAPKLDRIGVGDHLMLGGDNIDLSLAHMAEKLLTKDSKKLSTADLYQLIEQCRSLKETLLARNAPDDGKVTLLGSGSRLISGARSVSLTRKQIEQIVLDGFFPLSALNDFPDRKRSGVVEFGLPYVPDPAITKHIAAFLSNHRSAIQETNGDDGAAPVPDAILLNGGMFRSELITDRVLKILSKWRGKSLRLLENPQPELAVAFGAVAYAMARRGQQLKIGGGSARSYFLQVADRQEKTQHGVCILPRGSEEGQEIRLADQVFSLRLGQPVRFHLVSSSESTRYKSGAVVDLSDEHFVSLPPLAATLEHKSSNDRTEEKVEIAATLTEYGTVQIQCVSLADNKRRWDVQFQLRAGKQTSSDSAQSLPPNFEDAVKRIQQVFGQKSQSPSAKMVKGLRNDLEKMLGPRLSWEPALLRELFRVLLEGVKNRRRSAEHERVWLSLVGFCLRPGFGVELDDWRCEQIWRIYGPNPQFLNEAQNWTEWWTLWRRIAGGLSAEQQSQIFADIAKFINPATARQGKTATQIKKRGYEDLIRLAGVLERLPAEDKIQIGNWLRKRLEKSSEPDQSWWAMGRIGARVPFHGSTHNVVPTDTVTQWLEFLFNHDWKKRQHIGFAATMLCRLSGDRERDIKQADRDKVLQRLSEIKAPASWSKLIEQVTQADESDTKRIFGEALPPGLKLL